MRFFIHDIYRASNSLVNLTDFKTVMLSEAKHLALEQDFVPFRV